MAEAIREEEISWRFGRGGTKGERDGVEGQSEGSRGGPEAGAKHGAQSTYVLKESDKGREAKAQSTNQVPGA